MLGIEDGTYEIYSNFKRKVLNIALHEINLKSDICIDLVEHKVNRKVVSIEFLFRKITMLKITQFSNINPLS